MPFIKRFTRAKMFLGTFDKGVKETIGIPVLMLPAIHITKFFVKLNE